MERRKTPIRYLPDDILADILSRLPANALHGRFRYVSKRFDQMIRDPFFIDIHLARSQPGLLLQPRPLLSPSHWLVTRFATIDRGRPLLQDLPSFPTFKAYNSCNGLVLLKKLSKRLQSFSVYNPVTGEYIELPAFDESHSAGGIGFDRSTKEYKVVVLCAEEGSDTIRECKVLTSSSMRWRVVNGPSCPVRWKTGPIFADGALHWDRDGRHLITFDVEHERFERIDLHKEQTPGDVSRTMVSESGGHVAIVERILGRPLEYRAWIFNGKCGRDRTTLCFINPESKLPRGVFADDVVCPNGILRRGLVFFRVGKLNPSLLIVRDGEDGAMTGFEVESRLETKTIDCCMSHVNSLASWNNNLILQENDGCRCPLISDYLVMVMVISLYLFYLVRFFFI